MLPLRETEFLLLLPCVPASTGLLLGELPVLLPHMQLPNQPPDMAAAGAEPAPLPELLVQPEKQESLLCRLQLCVHVVLLAVLHSMLSQLQSSLLP